MIVINWLINLLISLFIQLFFSFFEFRTVKCDQDAFDILYDSYQARYNNGETSVGNIREKVAILDRDALNSGKLL